MTSHLSSQPQVTLGTCTPAPSPPIHPQVSLGQRGDPHPRWRGAACRNASLASPSCQAKDKSLLSQWPLGRQFIYLGCCSLIVHGNVYPKYLIAGLHKRRLPGAAAQAAVGAGTHGFSLGTAKVKDTFSRLPKNHILSASKADNF